MYIVSVLIVLAGTVNKFFYFNSVLTVPASTVNTLTYPYPLVWRELNKVISILNYRSQD